MLTSPLLCLLRASGQNSTTIKQIGCMGGWAMLHQRSDGRKKGIHALCFWCSILLKSNSKRKKSSEGSWWLQNKKILCDGSSLLPCGITPESETPFDFATVNGRKTRDIISKTNFFHGHQGQMQFITPCPFIITSYSFSYHVNTQFHTVRHDATITKQICASISHQHMCEL
jgi:hypothetical protein